MRKQASNTVCPWNSRSTSGNDERPQEREDDQPAGERGARPRGLPDDGAATLVVGAAVRDRAPDLLLEREEEPGRDDEQQDPEPVQRGVVGLGETAEREDLESVRGDTRR